MEIEKVHGYERIYQLDSFVKEFEEAASEKKASGRYHRWLMRQLAILDEEGKSAIKLPGFEKLSDTTPDLYSIRYPKSKKNPRIIYIHISDGKITLLNAFKEGKGSDYRMAVEVSQKRAKYCIETI